MAFSDEADFERALITVLFDKGWRRDVIQYPTEKDLIRNWPTFRTEIWLWIR